jgi:hypothetical protein
MSDKERRIYELKLHETIMFGVGFAVKRVPGGWIYFNTTSDWGVFVPLNNEFMPEAKP